MTIARQLRRKREREEKDKARREWAEESERREKVVEYHARLREAYEAKDYRTALEWSLKIIDLYPADNEIRNIVVYCAYELEDMETLHRVLEEGWEAGVLKRKDHLLMLGEDYFDEGSYSKAVEVLKPLVRRTPGLIGTLSPRMARTASSYYYHAHRVFRDVHEIMRFFPQ